MELLTAAVLVTIMISYILSLASQINSVLNECKHEKNDKMKLNESKKMETLDTIPILGKF